MPDDVRLSRCVQVKPPPEQLFTDIVPDDTLTFAIARITSLELEVLKDPDVPLVPVPMPVNK